MQTILNSGDWKGNRIVYLLLFLLLFILGTYIYFFSFLDESYSPYYGDEFFYFKNSEKFYQSNSLQATFTYSGSGSKILGADAHGPGYPLIYGTIAKIIGWGALTIPIANLAFLLLATFFLVLNTKLKDSLLKLILVFGCPITLFYSITFLPELIHIAGAIGLLILLERYISKEKASDFIWILVLIFCLGMIRNTWFFSLFGLGWINGPLKRKWKLVYVILGLGLPFIFQIYFHEQVPNVFSQLVADKENGLLLGEINLILENFLQNLDYTFTYADGDFYIVQKIWIYLSFLVAILFYRKDNLTRCGIIILGSIILFNLFLYKNYTWVDLRMYVPMTIFLNLRILRIGTQKPLGIALLGINLISFVLILPLQHVMINYRIGENYEAITPKITQAISELDSPLILIDSIVLANYEIVQLPLLTKEQLPITYMLPYYKMPSKNPTHTIFEKDGQLCLKSTIILNQNTKPSNACTE